MSQQLDPYYLAPQWIDSISLAALQARLMLDKGIIKTSDMAAVVAASRRCAMKNDKAQLAGQFSISDLLEEPGMSLLCAKLIVALLVMVPLLCYLYQI